MIKNRVLSSVHSNDIVYLKPSQVLSGSFHNSFYLFGRIMQLVLHFKGRGGQFEFQERTEEGKQRSVLSREVDLDEYPPLLLHEEGISRKKKPCW